LSSRLAGGHWVSDRPSKLAPTLPVEVGRERPGILMRQCLEGRVDYRMGWLLPWPIFAGDKEEARKAGGGCLSIKSSEWSLGTPLTSAIWISSGSSRGWLGPLAKLRFWWAGHMFCRRWLCICFRCFLHRGRVGEPDTSPSTA
jgi:hypothetical protein